MFCTLGNVEADSRVGLLFVDLLNGRTLQATGTAQQNPVGRGMKGVL